MPGYPCTGRELSHKGTVMTAKADILKIDQLNQNAANTPDKAAALADAFEVFSQMSDQLTSSYRALEQRVADLN